MGIAIGIDDQGLAADHGNVKILAEKGDLAFETIGAAEVVGIHSGDELAACHGERFVEGEASL